MDSAWSRESAPVTDSSESSSERIERNRGKGNKEEVSIKNHAQLVGYTNQFGPLKRAPIFSPTLEQKQRRVCISCLPIHTTDSPFLRALTVTCKLVKFQLAFVILGEGG